MSENLLVDIFKDNNIQIIEPNHNYWFVRTQGGEYFDDFHYRKRYRRHYKKYRSNKKQYRRR